jgi:hypothetical protein
MDANRTFPLRSLGQFVVSFCAQVCAALAVGFDGVSAMKEGEQHVDPNSEGWLHSVPMATGNVTSRYGLLAPGYLTSNGRGSLEVGAADD